MQYYSLKHLADENTLSQLPFSIRILLEASLRNQDGSSVLQKDIDLLLAWEGNVKQRQEIAFKPGRVVLQDFTGVPAIVDLAALRSAMLRQKGDPKRINPQTQVDLVIDHSIQVDYSASSNALQKNMEREFERNRERYEFLKWGEQAFENLRIIPPGVGIVHQVNLEYLADVVLEKKPLLYPDTLVGTDSHTTMINALGVLGWGVGGIEAESVMLGQAIDMLVPDVVGFRLHGKLPVGTTATDLVLLITQILRKHGVVGKFVEFFGPGLENLSLPDRATIANMAPEYGATCGYFPVDKETLRYLEQTGRSLEQVDLVEKYYTAQGLFHREGTKDPKYSDQLELDLSKVGAAIAGPRRPQDRINLEETKSVWEKQLQSPLEYGGFGISPEKIQTIQNIDLQQKESSETTDTLTHGSIVIAAITSCTNTSNPGLMISAGLIAKKAIERKLGVKPHVKTSLAPGSRVVSDYLDASGLTSCLEGLGFHTVGYGCTTCIGNSGPLDTSIVSAIEQGELVVASVLSGNRNFEGRISPHVKANFLASPPLVVAYALAGNMNVNITKEPLGKDTHGRDVFLEDIWPTEQEVQSLLVKSVQPKMYSQCYANLSKPGSLWEQVPVTKQEIYKWDKESTYIREPDFFSDMPPKPGPLHNIEGARCLVKVGKSVTTDHISPAGAIPEDMPAGLYLIENGVKKEDFNSFGSRRGNDQVMTRGTFSNIRLRNQLAPGTEGGWTTHYPSGEKMSIFDASLLYKKAYVPLIILAGEEYGTGSSRDWAAKGTYTLGCRAVIATSYERIHRSNLVGMGVLPLQFRKGESHESLKLTGTEIYSILGIHDNMKSGVELEVRADEKTFHVICRLDTPVEIEYYKNGGILHTVLRNFCNN